MRRFLPQTLPAWVLLIVIAGLLVSQVATLGIVAYDRRAANEVLELYRLDERAFSLVQLMSGEPAAERKRLAAALSNSTYALVVSDSPAVKSSIAPDDSLAELEDVIVGRLTKFGVIDARVRRDSAGRGGPEGAAAPNDAQVGAVERDLLSLAASFASSSRLTASIQFADGQWLNFITPITPLRPVLTWESGPLYVAVALLVVLMSIWSIRRLTAPYRLMESAVRRIGADLKSPPVSERGSREYRAAARAVNGMQATLREYVEDREQLAAALAHDLRTPLTRMRLRMETVEDVGLRNALTHDIGDIDAIARSVIDFATLEVTEEAPERIDFWSLVDAIADGYPQIAFGGDGGRSRGLVCLARPVALRRCVTNLLENAITYGERATLQLRHEGDAIVLTILDQGPGIPETELDAVFRPFVRVEKSRNRKTGGLGLGLTIARNIARGLGGDVHLTNNPGGGLRTELRLPRVGDVRQQQDP